MADESKRSQRKATVNRRSYLKATAGAAGIAAFGLNAAAAADDYEEIVVDAGDTYSVSLGDGDTLENVLIDISASGAGYSINADGDGWAIRNVGVRGTFDSHSNDSQITLNTPSSDSTGVVENVYLPGASSPGHSYDGAKGIYVFRDHAGEILIRNVNIKRMQDNGIYASSPGHDADNALGGTVRVEDSYFEDNATVGIRLGTSGSYAENCVMVGGIHRGFWAYYEETELRNCDLLDNGTDVVVGGGSYDKQAEASVVATDSRWESEDLEYDSNDIQGESQGTPEDRVPEGVPTSAEAAASGSADSGNTGGSADSDSSDDTDDESALPQGDFALTVSTDGDLAEYVVELDAEDVTAGEGADTHDHDYEDRAFERNGNWYVHGYTAGGSETFQVTGGEILRLGAAQGSPLFTADGQRLDTGAVDSISAIPDAEDDADTSDDTDSDADSGSDSDTELANRVVVDGTQTDDVSTYKFTVSGTVESDPEGTTLVDGGSDWDTIEDNVSEDSVVGVVSEGEDAYVYSGEVTNMVIRGNATVTIQNE